MELYTKNGRPLRVLGGTVYTASGKPVGQIRGDKVLGTNGHYVGTIINGRLVHRTSDSAAIGTPFAPTPQAGIAKPNATPSAVLGDEPNIPD